MMTPKTIGNLIRRRRKEIRMDQRELALVSGTGVRFISDLENGKETCQLGKALKVLGNLGLELTLAPKGRAQK
jgi:y4mF family transcriptional regulator